MKCKDCSKESYNKSLCHKCLKRARETVKRKRDVLKEQGVCIQCKKDNDVFTLRCAKCGGGKKYKKIKKPYDKTNSSNPWLLNKKNTNPIIGPEGKMLTAEYIWSKCGDDRVKLVDWVFNYYKRNGYPFFKIGDDELKKEFDKLKLKSGNIIEKNGVIINSNTTGLKIAKHFTDELFMRTRGSGKTKSCIDVFNDDELFKKVLMNRMGWNKTNEGGKERTYVFAIDDAMITQGMRSSALAHNTSHFKPMIAKYIYEKYNIKSTLDYSAGWGARCVAALSCDISYYGIDPLTANKVNEIIEYFGGTGFVINGCSENTDYSKIPYVDMSFSSPPYFDLEIYSDDKTQSSNYKKYEDWLSKYWKPTVENCSNKSKYFSMLVVDKVRKLNLLQDMHEICMSVGLNKIDEIPISVSKNHLSGKSKSKSVTKKTEYIIVYKAI